MNFNPEGYGMRGYDDYSPFEFYSPKQEEPMGGLLGEYMRRLRGMQHYGGNKGGPVDSTLESNLTGTYVQNPSDMNIMSTDNRTVSDYTGEY